MKKLILLELCFLFFATTFRGDSPPSGWYLQQIPVNKQITDIYFTDTLNGWAVASSTEQLDSGYIIKTTNGGANWLTNFSTNRNLFAVQFTDLNTGYACGGWGYGNLYKTTNSGNNWNMISTSGTIFTDLHFLNSDTGWICDRDFAFGVGLLKTTNGGLNWTQQMDNTYQPKKLFFLNQDTGWVMTNDRKLYRTMNSGNNWTFLHTFADMLYSIYFTSIDTGWVIQYGTIFKTTNGGVNWIIQPDPNSGGSFPYDISMIKSNYGYISTSYSKIIKTLDGNNWNRQNAPDGGYTTLFFKDSLHGWVRHGYLGINDIASTVDGGGPVIGIKQISGEVPDGFKLEQNYPNPFNSISKIKYQISKTSNIKIVIFDISGREISVLVNQRQSPGTYEYNFDGSDLSSGVYFYALLADGKRIDTKKMILIK